jgi:hypothetical protein
MVKAAYLNPVDGKFERECIICHTKFRTNVSNQKVCSQECYKEKTKSDKEKAQENALIIVDETIANNKKPILQSILRRKKNRLIDKKYNIFFNEKNLKNDIVVNFKKGLIRGYDFVNKTMNNFFHGNLICIIPFVINDIKYRQWLPHMYLMVFYNIHSNMYIILGGSLTGIQDLIVNSPHFLNPKYFASRIPHLFTLLYENRDYIDVFEFIDPYLIDVEPSHYIKFLHPFYKELHEEPDGMELIKEFEEYIIEQTKLDYNIPHIPKLSKGKLGITFDKTYNGWQVARSISHNKLLHFGRYLYFENATIIRDYIFTLTIPDLQKFQEDFVRLEREDWLKKYNLHLYFDDAGGF